MLAAFLSRMDRLVLRRALRRQGERALLRANYFHKHCKIG